MKRSARQSLPDNPCPSFSTLGSRTTTSKVAKSRCQGGAHRGQWTMPFRLHLSGPVGPWRLPSMKHSLLALGALLGVTAVTAQAEYFRFIYNPGVVKKQADLPPDPN